MPYTMIQCVFMYEVVPQIKIDVIPNAIAQRVRTIAMGKGLIIIGTEVNGCIIVSCIPDRYLDSSFVHKRT